MFVTGKSYTRCIADILGSAATVDIAVAFLGAGADDLVSRGGATRVICNLESGATNPVVVEALLRNPSVQIRTLASLHAKVFITDRAALTGSANLSANGLGLEARETATWEEAGIVTTEPSVVQAASRWFSALWRRSTAITEKNLKLAKDKWKHRRSRRPTVRRDASRVGLFAHLMADWEFSKDRPLFLTVHRQPDVSKAAAEEIDRLQKEDGEDGMLSNPAIDYYENWSNLPEDAYLVDLHYGPRGGTNLTGLFWTGQQKIERSFLHPGDEEGTLTVVFKQTQYEGLRVRRHEMNWFAGLVKPHIGRVLEKKRGPEEDKESAAVNLPLHEALVIMSEGKRGLRPTSFA